MGWKDSSLAYENCTQGTNTLNRKRLYNASYKDKPEVKKRRKIIRAKAKSKGDQDSGGKKGGRRTTREFQTEGAGD